ncbi:MAG: hypothetical protein ACE3JQ_00625 [Paenisporosarcina sp.]
MENNKEKITPEEKSKIFNEELNKLKDMKYLDDFNYQKVSNAYIDYRKNIEKEKESTFVEKVKVPNNMQHSKVESKPIVQNVQKVKKQKSAEELRERNISIILMIGVMLLLFGGMILATTNWGNINNLTKVMIIFMISVFFGSMSFISYKLKIKQTAFAFLTLSSLFIPITLVAIAYYKLLGEYLSLEGEGRALLGVFGGILALLIYFKIARYFQSKMFSILTLIIFSLTVSFALAYATPSVEVFFMLMMAFNIFILWNTENIKNNKQLSIFRDFIFQFIQFKVMIEGFIIFTLFSDNMFYSLTLIFTSFVFLILAIRFNKKMYNFAFSPIFTYGYLHLMYAIIPNNIEVIFVSILPLLFIYLSAVLEKEHPFIAKSFYFTSLTASVFAFVFINVNNYANSQEYNMESFISIIILMINFVFITLKIKNAIFSTVVFFLTNVSLIYIVNEFTTSIDIFFYILFGTQLFIYTMFYLYNHKLQEKGPFFLLGAWIIPLITMIPIIIRTLIIEDDWLFKISVYVIIAFVLFITHQRELNLVVKNIIRFIAPISFSIALILTFELLNQTFDAYDQWIVNLIFISYILLAIGYMLRVKYKDFLTPIMIIAPIYSIIALLNYPTNELSDMMESLVVIMIIGVSALSTIYFNKKILWILVVIPTLVLSYSLLELFNMMTLLDNGSYLLGLGLFLSIISMFIKKWTKDGSLIFGISAAILSIVTTSVLFAFQSWMDKSIVFYFALPILSYLILFMNAQKQRTKVILSYLSLTSFIVMFWSMIEWFEISLKNNSEAFLLVSILTIILWGIGNTEWKKVFENYLLFTVNSYIIFFPIEVYFKNIDYVHFFTISAGIAISIAIMIKRNWNFPLILPLLISIIFYTNYASGLSIYYKVVIYLVVASIMLILSKQFFKGLWSNEGALTIDWFRITAFIMVLLLNGNVFSMNPMYRPMMLVEVIVALSLPLYFFAVWVMTTAKIEKRIYLVCMTVLSLHPYLVFMDYINVPAFLTTEVVVIPMFIIGTLIIRRIYVSKWSSIIELIVVGVLFLILLIDALVGNTMNDAIVIGVISISSIVLGFVMKYISYFLVGIIAILLNVYLNTKSLWGNLPWWLYLIIGGILLISLASFFEWKKQKEKSTSKEILEKNKQKFKKIFLKWN